MHSTAEALQIHLGDTAEAPQIHLGDTAETPLDSGMGRRLANLRRHSSQQASPRRLRKGDALRNGGIAVRFGRKAALRQERQCTLGRSYMILQPGI